MCRCRSMSIYCCHKCLSSSTKNTSVTTVKSRVQYALVHNMQSNFSLLWMRKIEVHVYRTSYFLRTVPNAFNAKILSLMGLHRFSSPHPTVLVCVWVVQVSWLMRRQSGYYVTYYSCHGWANVAAASWVTRHSGWSLRARSIALMYARWALWIPKIVSMWAVECSGPVGRVSDS